MIAKSVPIPATVEIPVMIPVLPWTFWMFVTASFISLGWGMMICGGTGTLSELVYPRPTLVTLIDATDPFVMVAVPVAVVPIPTPINLGEENLTSTVAVVYPVPTFVISIVEVSTLPRASTPTVAAAETTLISSNTTASTYAVTTLDSFSS